MERKYKITILIIVLLALLLAAVDLFSGSKRRPSSGREGGAPRLPKPSDSRMETPRPATPMPFVTNLNSSPPPLVENAKITADLVAKLPYTASSYSIEYFPKTHQLSVTIFTENENKAKAEVYEWLRKEGITNPESLPILWSKNKRFSP